MTAIEEDDALTPAEEAFAKAWTIYNRRDLTSYVKVCRLYHRVWQEKREGGRLMKWRESLSPPLHPKDSERMIGLVRLFGEVDTLDNQNVIDKMSNVGRSVLYELALPSNADIWDAVKKMPTVTHAAVVELLAAAKAGRVDSESTDDDDDSDDSAADAASLESPPAGATKGQGNGSAHAKGYAPNRSRLVNRHRQDSDDEWWSPSPVVEAARRVLGEISLDPCSCPEANEVVKALKFFDKEANGLVHEWFATGLWLNPPFGNNGLGQFTKKLLQEIKAGRTTAAIMLASAQLDAKWFHTAAKASTLVCIPLGMLTFRRPKGTQRGMIGSVIFGFNVDPQAFRREFKDFGLIADFTPQAEIAPTEEAPVSLTREQGKALLSLTGGNLKKGTPAMIKAARH